MDRERLFASRVNKGTQDQQGGDATGQRVWEDVQAVLESRLPREEFDRWIAELRLVAEVEGEMLLAAKDPVALDRVNTRHKREIERLWTGMDPLVRTIKLICWRTAPAELRDLIGDPWAVMPEDEQADFAEAPTGGPAMTFENLVIGPSNKTARKWRSGLRRAFRPARRSR